MAPGADTAQIEFEPRCRLLSIQSILCLHLLKYSTRVPPPGTCSLSCCQTRRWCAVDPTLGPTCSPSLSLAAEVQDGSRSSNMAQHRRALPDLRRGFTGAIPGQ